MEAQFITPEGKQRLERELEFLRLVRTHDRDVPVLLMTGGPELETARLAIEARCPIVPMVITGSDRFFKHFPRRATVTVQLLPHLYRLPGETALALTDRLMFGMAAALPEDMRGVYAEIPSGFGK